MPLCLTLPFLLTDSRNVPELASFVAVHNEAGVDGIMGAGGGPKFPVVRHPIPT